MEGNSCHDNRSYTSNILSNLFHTRTSHTEIFLSQIFKVSLRNKIIYMAPHNTTRPSKVVKRTQSRRIVKKKEDRSLFRRVIGKIFGDKSEEEVLATASNELVLASTTINEPGSSVNALHNLQVMGDLFRLVKGSIEFGRICGLIEMEGDRFKLLKYPKIMRSVSKACQTSTTTIQSAGDVMSSSTVNQNAPSASTSEASKKKRRRRNRW